MKISIWSGVLLALVLCGCKSAPKKEPQPVFGSNGITVVERSAKFYEKQPRPIPTDAYRPQVDYQSELRITIDPTKLLAESNTNKSVLPPLTPAQKTQLDTLSELIKSARQYLHDFNNFVAQFDALKSQGTPQSVAAAEKLINTQAESELKLLLPLNDYVAAKVRAEHPNFTRSQHVQELTRLSAPIITTNGVLDLAALSEFVAKESDAIIRQASEDARAVRDAGSVYLRMRATVFQPGKAEVPLHIKNYDTLSDANVVQEPRISFQMSDDDRKRIEAETKVNTEISQFIRDLQNSKSDLRQSLNSILDAVREDLKSWKDAVAQLDDLKQKLAPVIAALDKAGVSTNLSAQQKLIVNDARTILNNASNQIQVIRQAINTFVTTNTPDSNPADVLVLTVNSFSKMLTEFRPLTIVSNIQTTLGHLEQLKTDIANAPQSAPDLKDLVDALKAAAPSSAAAITNLLQVTLAQYPSLVAEMKSLSMKSRIADAESSLPPIHSDPSLIDVSVDSPPEGYISLARNVARGGVTVGLDGALVKRSSDPSIPPSVKPVLHQEYDVEKFGAVNTWSASLIFVYRLGDLDPGEREVQFSPAPSVSWTLQYNPPPGHWMKCGFWDAFYPGIGVNVDALNWDDGVQVGMGGHMSFFHDLLIGGAGYNLNESRHGVYVFIGLGIFQSLNKLGVTGDNFPLGN